eukprot:2573127-Prymnesium_polylepis.1
MRAHSPDCISSVSCDATCRTLHPTISAPVCSVPRLRPLAAYVPFAKRTLGQKLWASLWRPAVIPSSVDATAFSSEAFSSSVPTRCTSSCILPIAHGVLNWAEQVDVMSVSLPSMYRACGGGHTRPADRSRRASMAAPLTPNRCTVPRRRLTASSRPPHTHLWLSQVEFGNDAAE